MVSEFCEGERIIIREDKHINDIYHNCVGTVTGFDDGLNKVMFVLDIDGDNPFEYRLSAEYLDHYRSYEDSKDVSDFISDF